MHCIQEIQAEVGMWHREKFGESSDELNEAILQKVEEEARELWDANKTDGSSVPLECADVVIAVMAYCDRVGIDLEESVLKKMRVNWCREWKKIDGKYVRDKTS